MTTVKGKFLLRGTDFEVEIEAKPEDVKNVGPELAVRAEFLREAARRLGNVCLNDWEFLGLVSDQPQEKSGAE